MKRLLHLILFYTLMMCSFAGVAQDYIIQIEHFGIEEGLSHRNVNFALQDRRGLMWFGTNYGLNRFDGYKFRWFTKEKHGLQSNLIYHAEEDNNGLLWLFYGDARMYAGYTLNLSGIDIFDPVSCNVQSFETFFEGKTELKPSDIIGLSKKDNGDLVFLTREGRLFTYLSSNSFSSVSLKGEYHQITDFHWSSNEHYWIRGKKDSNENAPFQVIGIDEEGKEKYTFPIEPPYEYAFFYQEENSKNERWINVSAEEEGFEFFEVDGNGQLIANSDAIMYSEIDLDFSTFHRIAHYRSHEEVNCFTSSDGFYLFEKETKKLHLLSESDEYIQWTNDITFDNTGKIWVSSQFGIYRVTFRKNRFVKMMTRDDELKPIRTIRQDDQGDVWLVVQGQPNFWKIEINPDNKRDFQYESVNNAQNPNRIGFDSPFLYAFEFSENGDLYYPPSFYSTAKIRLDNFESKSFQPLPAPSYGAFVWSYFEDSAGRLWGGYDNGKLALFGEGKSEWISLQEDENAQFTIYQFIETEQGLWLITESGLFLFDPENRKVKERYFADGEGQFRLPFDDLRHAYLEKNSATFWFGTGGSGLIRFNIETGEYRQFTKADGFSDNVIYAVYPDDFGNLWLTSDYGIMRFNKTSHQVSTFLTKEGISHNEFNRVAHHQDDDGTLFFGGLNGVTAFHPKDFQTDSSALVSPLVVHQFQQFVGGENKLVDKTIELLSDHTITLQPDDPFFRLEFGLLTYEDVDKIQYAYQIEGQDQDWNYQKENYIRLSRLPYGSHWLKIKGQAANGQWSSRELNIRVEVLKPFYLKMWFLVTVGLVLFSAIFFFFKWRTMRLEKQKAILEEEVKNRTQTIREQAEKLKSMEKLKSRFFANVSHELRTPLTLMLGPINKLEKGGISQEKRNRLISFLKNNSRHLLKLVNEILDLSKLETNRLEIKETKVNFYLFLQPMIAQFKSSGDSEFIQLDFEYHADKTLNIALDTGKFEKIVHNFLSNALKFTPENGHIVLSIQEFHEQLLVKVADTGEGIHPNDLPYIFDRFYQSKQPDAQVQGGTGIGLSLCKELAELLGGSVWAESELGVGSTFYFEFPKQVVKRCDIPIEDSLLDEELERLENFASLENDIVAKAKEALENSAISETLVHDMQRKTILVVEDNPELREYLTVLLSEDYNVITAGNGKVGYERLMEANHCELIVSDLMMPIMDGFQFLEKVKSNDLFRHIPVIMLTARTDVRVKLRALRIGVDDYLTKPFVEEELKVRIENLLRNYEERVAAHLMEINQNGTEEKPVIAEADMEWLGEVEENYRKYIKDSRLTIEFIAGKMFLSGRQFHRRLKRITGLTPNNYLQEMRLTQAREFIESQRYLTIKESCHAVGFSDVKYFSRIFRQRFGMSPSDVRK